MAKHVVLTFDNDIEADAFVNSINEGGKEASIRVIGIFKRPTIFCTCTVTSEKGVRGAKYGWWLCRNCGKPVKGRWIYGHNLMDPVDVKYDDKRVSLGVQEGAEEPPHRING